MCKTKIDFFFFMSLEFPPSYSNFPMYHRNYKLLTVRIILNYLIICKQYLTERKNPHTPYMVSKNLSVYIALGWVLIWVVCHIAVQGIHESINSLLIFGNYLVDRRNRDWNHKSQRVQSTE